MEAKFAKNAYWNFLIWGIFSSLGITICTIIDAVLVGNYIGSSGLAVVNITTPVFLTYSLIGLTMGVGANVLIGKSLGASLVEKANKIFSGLLTMGMVIGLAFMLLTYIFKKEICLFLGANDELIGLTVQYLGVVFLSSPLFIIYHILAVSVRTDGEPKLVALSSGMVILTNLCLDILFLKVLRWGIVGASASLCIAEAVGTVILLLHFSKRHALLKLRFSIPEIKDIKNFVINGFGIGSAFIFQAVTMLIFNGLLLSAGTRESVIFVAAYGVIYTMSTVPFAIFDGAGNALSTVVSIFAGEKDTEGILTVLKLGIQIVSVTSIIVVLIFLISAENILAFFGLGEETSLKTLMIAFQLFSVSIFFTGINTLASVFWQTIGRARLASVMSVVRNFGLMIVLGFVLISRYQLIGLSISYLVSEVICFIVLVLLMFFRGSKEYVQKKYGDKSLIYEKYYTIQTESIGQVSNDLEQICEAWEINPKQAFFIHLIAEELILNIIKFGLRDTRQKYYISIKLIQKDEEYIIRIRDNVSTYNPFDSSGDAIDEAALKIITQKTKYCDYQRKLIFNYLYLVV